MTSKVATMKKMRLCEKDKEYRLYAEVRKSEIFRLKAKYQTMQLQKLAANLCPTACRFTTDTPRPPQKLVSLMCFQALSDWQFEAVH